MLHPGQSLIPLDLPGYHERVNQLNTALRAHDDEQALTLCQKQLSELLTPEILVCLHFILLRQGWPVLLERLRLLSHLCFPQRFPAPEPLSKPKAPVEHQAPKWLRHWLSPPAPPRLSVCMIVRNEAILLPQALDSIAELADEIVIVDTGSTDQTREIARQYSDQVRLFETSWQDDFAAARNVSLDQACGDWIFVLDADEVLAETSHANLRNFFSFQPLGWNLFVLEQHNLSDSPEQLFRVQMGRIFTNHHDLRFHGLLHELLKRQTYPWYLHSIYLQGIHLIHRGALSEQRLRHQKSARNQLLDRAMLLSSHQCPYLWFQKGHVLLNQEPPDLIGARTLLEQSLHASVRQAEHIPPAQSWSPAPIHINLLYLLQCLFQLQNTKAMTDHVLNFQAWTDLYETRALGGWALARENQTEHAKKMLTAVFQPGLPALRRDLRFYRQLALEGLLDCALADERPWLALAYLWQLQQYKPTQSLNLVEYRLCLLVDTTPPLARHRLRALICGSDAPSPEQTLEYSFAFLSREFCPEILNQAQQALMKLGYVSLYHPLTQVTSEAANSHRPEPEIATLPGQWQWYELLERYS